MHPRTLSLQRESSHSTREREREREREKERSTVDVMASDGYRLLPSASDIGFFAKYADALAIGSCAPLASAFVDAAYAASLSLRYTTA